MPADQDAKNDTSLPSEPPGKVQPQVQATSDDEDNRLKAFNEHHALLFSVTYRMLGSRADAEDMLQETFLRWRQASHVEVRDPRAFLVTVITRLCINQLQSARVIRELYFGQWLPEPLLTGAAAGMPNKSGIDGSLSMAFLMLLERLTPMERAVFPLREVFDYEYAEVAEMLGQTEANCRQILKRAKQHVTEDRPRFDVSPQQRQKLLQQFLETTAHAIPTNSRASRICRPPHADTPKALHQSVPFCHSSNHQLVLMREQMFRKAASMKLAYARLVTKNVSMLAAFYEEILGVAGSAVTITSSCAPPAAHWPSPANAASTCSMPAQPNLKPIVP